MTLWTLVHGVISVLWDNPPVFSAAGYSLFTIDFQKKYSEMQSSAIVQSTVRKWDKAETTQKPSFYVKSLSQKINLTRNITGSYERKKGIFIFV